MKNGEGRGGNKATGGTAIERKLGNSPEISRKEFLC